MGITKGEARIRKQKLNDAQRGFTRAKALRELNNGGDFNDTRFTNHKNRHVRDRAWALAGYVIPDNEVERNALLESLSKNTTDERQEYLKTRFAAALPANV